MRHGIRSEEEARTIATLKDPMGATHKAALANGREKGRIVRGYLDALERATPRRGRKRSAESARERLATIEVKIAGAEPLKRLHLAQERSDLESELNAGDTLLDVANLEEEFIKVAASYGERKGLSYSTWRAVGVSAQTLQEAGITRTCG